MKTAYQYRLRPTQNQSAQMENWLNLLRMQYNYRLRERFDWWDHHRCPINYCPLVCSIAPPKEQPEYYGQKRDLVQTKVKFPEYGDVYSDVLQDCVGRVKKTFDRFIKGDINGSRSGRPRFKKPTISPSINIESVVGIDMGLKEFLVTSEGEVVSIPQFARKSEKRRRVLNKALSRKKKKGTQRRQKAGKHLSKHYQKVVRQRKDFHYKTAHQLLSKYDVIAHEDARRLRGKLPPQSSLLNIKGLAKTHLSKSVLDAGWGDFIGIVVVKAERAGLLTVAVNPSGTTQLCSTCGTKVPKTLKDRWHSCPHCKLELDRDLNAALNIKQRVEGHPIFKAQRLLCDSRIG